MKPDSKISKFIPFVIALLLGFAMMACSLGGLVGGDSAGENSNESTASGSDAEGVDEVVVDIDESAAEATEAEESDPPLSAAAANAHPCNNIFYPLIEEQQWIYLLTIEDEETKFGLTVSDVDASEATVDMLAYETGVTTATEVLCEEGAILYFPNMMLGFLFGDVDGDLEIIHEDGLFMPSEGVLFNDDMEYEWETELSASGTLTAIADGDELTAILSDSPVIMDWEFKGEQEEVEVEAGVYADAYKVTRKTEIEASLEMNIEGESLNLEGTIILDTTLWYVPGVGLIKQEVDRMQLKLGPASFPVESDTVIELVEFYAAD